ncbi:sigma-54 interaction domain-containing protein [Pseudalkalibacillus berkeleyi]|uniref:Sigma 54-interacting transcriptional regulator n=1 Tax=Pseudalkalibacillus berkeleyi TaxID=1069813 RepID=A0ABS9GZL6_9BACL|nr:sigma 54-interacting transcriptional regulator [Pseudalkalibacillus berkeleyi]MCF6137266.1 sigma 54-interacting transcriptional regulator [Pseudalkalibacillus berkeleyi]
MLLDVTNTREMLQAILSSIDEGIHVINNEGITVFYNEIASKHDGVPVEDVLGYHLLDVFPTFSKETSTLLKVIQSGEPIYNQHQRYPNAKGNLITTVNTTLPIVVGGQVVGAVEIAKDFTKIQQLSWKLLDLEARVKGATSSDHPKEYENGTNFRMNDILTKNDAFLKVKEMAVKASKSTSSIIVYGETGTGKELLVQAIHNASDRMDQSFIAQNCAAIPSTLLESILFGTAKGSYTGAVDRPGLFELADGGTLFLDELNSMPLDTQAKLLRVLQNGKIRRVGSTSEKSVDVRVIVAMNEHPKVCIENGTLRKDLYYRLNVIFLNIPPLRDRKEDLSLLMDHFIQRYNFKFGKLVIRVSDEVKELFNEYHWPGNVRELEHAIESALNVINEDTLTLEHIPIHFIEASDPFHEGDSIPSLRKAISDTEEKWIHKALDATDGNIQRAAKLLKIPRQTLQYKLSKMNEKHTAEN